MINESFELEKFKQYMELCDIRSANELKNLGDYPCSVQFLRAVLRGDKRLSDMERKRLYDALNKARAYKLTHDK